VHPWSVEVEGRDNKNSSNKRRQLELVVPSAPSFGNSSTVLSILVIILVLFYLVKLLLQLII